MYILFFNNDNESIVEGWGWRLEMWAKDAKKPIKLLLVTGQISNLRGIES